MKTNLIFIVLIISVILNVYLYSTQFKIEKEKTELESKSLIKEIELTNEIVEIVDSVEIIQEVLDSKIDSLEYKIMENEEKFKIEKGFIVSSDINELDSLWAIEVTKANSLGCGHPNSFRPSERNLSFNRP